MDTNEFDFENRIMNTAYSAADSDVEYSLRPKTLDEYVGQEKVKENLKVYIEAAKKRGDPLDHVLLYGPPGLGKTTLSNNHPGAVWVLKGDQLCVHGRCPV